MKLSVVMITKDAAEHLVKSLPSVQFADEIIVVDNSETNETRKIAEAHGAKVISESWHGFGPQKNIAIDHARGEWILSLDADEVVTSDARRAIEFAMGQDAADAFYLPRRTFFLGRWIMHGDWYPDWQLRLFKRDATRFSDARIHERVIETAQTSRLPGAFLDHYSYRNLSDYLEKFDRYTTAEAEKKRNQCWNGFVLLIKPWYRFLRQYVWQRGFLDGGAGFLIAGLSAFYVFVVHAKVYELRLSKGKKHA